MKKINIVISQNGWEYDEHMSITCKNVQKINDRSILVDDNVKIEFDEDFLH